VIAPLAPSSVVAEAFRAEHALWDARYREHVETCWAVEHGWWCCVCTALCNAADERAVKQASLP
jgi:hypothetical protein